MKKEMESKKNDIDISDLSTSYPAPLYQRVKNIIKDKIESGAFKPDEKIPSENELVDMLNISRPTVNRALRELTSEGQLIRLQGVGTFVAHRKPQTELLAIRSIADEIEKWGHEHSCEVLLLRKEKVERSLTEAMGLPYGTPVYHSLIIHRDNDTAIQLADRYVNPKLAPKYIEQDFRNTTPADYLSKTVPIEKVEHILEAIIPNRQVQKDLEIDPDEPCLVLHRKTWAYGLIATKNMFVYPGSRYRIGGSFDLGVSNL